MYYEQVQSVAMGSKLGFYQANIANLFMEEFEVKALSSAPHPPSLAKVCWWHFGYK